MTGLAGLTAALEPVVLQSSGKLGRAAANAPILAGTIVFGFTGLCLFYLAFVSDEFEAGIVLRVMSVALLALAVLAYVWPSRPWPH